ncbi:MAG: hypothetical protein ACW97X_03690, partial [Candidatus Hodarchaeales archaeon]
LIFDITRRDSFTNLYAWVDELYKNSGRGIMPIAVLGNKVDLRDEAENPVSVDDVLKFIDDLKAKLDIPYDIPYLETSAKTGENVDESFDRLAHNIRLFLTIGRQ